MSLILEALKKSEQQRRLGEAPTFGSPVVTTRRRRSLLPLFAILIVIAAAAAWWLMRPVAPTPTPVATDATPAPAPVQRAAHGTVAQEQRPMTTTKPGPSSADIEAKRRSARAQAPGATPAPPTTGATKPNAPASPTVVQATTTTSVQVKGAPPATTAPKTSGSPPAADTAAASGTPAPAATKPVDARAAAAVPSSDKPVSVPTDQTAAPNTAVASATPATPPAAAARPAPEGPALLSIWELPYSTRKDLPAIELSMHVYSSTPAQRFVVIKGDRHVEGDEIGQDLILREIRQDGLVLEFKGQRFLFPRNGR